MANYFFIGDGSEVLACESYRANAEHELKQLQAKYPHLEMSIYECDPCTITQDSEGVDCWEFPAERAAAERDYILPTLEELTE